MERGESFQIRIFKGDIREYKHARPAGLGFRGTVKGKMGYGATEKLDAALADEMLACAAANAALIEDEDVETLYRGGGAYPEADAFNAGLAGVSVARRIDMGKTLERLALEADPRIVSVDQCVVGSAEGHSRMVNSYGLDLSHSHNMAYAYVYARAAENGQMKVAGEVWHGRGFEGFNPEELAGRAAKKVVSYLNASPVPSGKYPVVLDNAASRELFAAFAGVFSAENVRKGFSLLGGKLNKPVAAAGVHLRDDAVCAGSLGFVPFDSEGVAAKDKALIENGVLRTVLHNMKTAAKDGVPPTGNGFRSGLGSAVGIACTNFYMPPGEAGRDELLRRMGTGLLITQFSGLHAGTNTVSGDFSLSALGFYVENGEIRKAVEQITVAGNFYELLKRVICAGNDLRFDMPGSRGTFGMPSLLVEELDVSGE